MPGRVLLVSVWRLGPISGGLLLSRFWWGSVFLVNVPIVVMGLVGAFALVPDSKNPNSRAGRSIRSTAVDCRLGSVVVGHHPSTYRTDGLRSPLSGWDSQVSFVLVDSSRGSLASATRCSNSRFFHDRRFSIAAAGESLGIFGLFGALFELTQFLQFDLGLSPFQAGLRILPMAGVLIVVAACRRSSSALIGHQIHDCTGLAAAAGGLWQISAAFARVA